MLLTANIFQPLIDVFQAVITYFHNDLGISWGWSIIVLTVCVRVVMVPLMVKQIKSMRLMQQHQPEMKAIQQRYKDDKQRQQQEMMKFYRENNVNPFASCLPLVMQLPVFVALFYMLEKNLRTDICRPVQLRFQKAYAAAHHLSSVAAAKGQTTACSTYPGMHVHGAGFLFIHDITNKATGLTLGILIILYVGTQIASTLLMAQPTMDANQRRMMMILPVFFVIFIVRFPSGLIVYWITTNAWTMLQQYAIRSRVGPPPAAATATASGDGGNGAAGEVRPTMMNRLLGAMEGRSGEAEGGSRKSGSGVSTGGNGRQQGGPPPPPPRKKKKRSGRRR